MFKLVTLFAFIAFAASAPAPGVFVGSPGLVAKIFPAPEAPASTVHAAHVAAIAPIVPIAYSAAPVYIAAHPITYQVAYKPIEAHGYKIAY